MTLSGLWWELMPPRVVKKSVRRLLPRRATVTP
jgi:hypothetical protein